MVDLKQQVTKHVFRDDLFEEILLLVFLEVQS